MMNYEIVELQEKTVAGLSARTNNMDPKIGAVIGGLWERFYQGGVYEAIEGKVNQKALGIYTDYAGTEKDDYSVVVACEVNGEAVQAGQAETDVVVRRIPAGKYAKFVVIGDMYKAVADFWSQLWTMDLPRAFGSDFEEYQNDDMENAEIHIYIGLKE